MLKLRLCLTALVVASAAAAADPPCGWDATQPRWDPSLPPPIAVLPDDAQIPPPSKQASSYEDQVMELVNLQRWNNGQLPPLKRLDLLDSSSETHSFNMGARNFFAHCDLDSGTLPWDRMVAAGYSWSYAGENIAAGYSSPSAVMAGWMGSSGHRANILSTNFRELGIGYVYDSSDSSNVRFDQNGDCVADSTGNGPYGNYWTQNFGRRNSVYPVVIDREAYDTDTRSVQLYVYGSGWASEMRIRNESSSWTAWQPFATEVAWQLSYGPGFKRVFVELRSGSTVRSASDTIVSTAEALPEIFDDGFGSGNTSAWSLVIE